MRSFDLASITESFRTAPLAWVGALAVAALPAAVLALKPSAPLPARAETPAPQPAKTASAGPGGGGFSDWFSGADNPFLTEDQARERRLRGSLAKVEEVLRRRPDVRDVTVLAAPASDPKSAAAGTVVTIRMQEGTVPVALVDAVGTLVAAAVPGVKPQDVTVIDEGTGIRARAVALDEAQSQDGRKALAAAERPMSAARVTPTMPATQSTQVSSGSESGSSPWTWLAGGATVVVVGALLWFTAARRKHDGSQAPPAAADDPIVGTLAMALHRCVAEQGALVTTALVERLEQGASPNEVAQLLLNLEPWAAERLLKGMPAEALEKVEQALRDPAGDASTISVRALAEAVISVRAAA